MGKETGISWTDHTFNPWWGCVRVSPGCKHCYAADLAGRYGQGWTPTSERRFMTAAWASPPKWNRAAQKAGKPAFVFCASMADIFEDVPEHVREQTEAARVRLWALIDATPWLVWLLLTKRPERVDAVIPERWKGGRGPQNVWLGCTVEDQEHARQRIGHLITSSIGARRFVSYEPALGPVDFRDVWGDGRPSGDALDQSTRWRVDWVIIGGESGPKARPFRVEWARDTIRQCEEAGVSAWMKQMGDEAVGQWMPPIKFHPDGRAPLGSFQSCQFKPARDGVGLAYRFRAHHGADPDEWPDDLRVQERPEPLPIMARPPAAPPF